MLFRNLFSALFIGFIFSTSSVFASAKVGWIGETKIALEKAAKDKKPILLYFTGSEWCPPCVELEKKVFSKKGTLQSLEKFFVLCKLDLPKDRKKISKEMQLEMKKHRVISLPQLILLDEHGKEFHRSVPVKHDSSEKMLDYLRLQLRRKEMF